MIRKFKSFPLSRVYELLEPGPVVMLTTSYRGRNNVMTMSWHTMMEFEPPLIGCVISNRDYSFNMLKSSRECVIGIPASNLASKMVQVGNSSGRDIDKFERFGLAISPASVVKAPLLQDCYANLECRLVNTRLVNEYNFFILEVVKAWIKPSAREPRTIHHLGNDAFMISGRRIRIPSKMK